MPKSKSIRNATNRGNRPTGTSSTPMNKAFGLQLTVIGRPEMTKCFPVVNVLENTFALSSSDDNLHNNVKMTIAEAIAKSLSDHMEIEDGSEFAAAIHSMVDQFHDRDAAASDGLYFCDGNGDRSRRDTVLATINRMANNKQSTTAMDCVLAVVPPDVLIL